MDQARITTTGFPLRSEFFTKAPDEIAGLKKFGRFQRTSNQEGGQTWTTIKFGPQQAAQMNARKVDGEWVCNSIRVYLPRWLDGCNGRAISDHETLLIALQRYFSAASLLAEDGFENHVLPGVGESNSSQWSSIEFPIHVYDPGNKLLLAFEAATHPSIENPSLVCRGQSVHLSGTRLGIRAYDKLRQLRKSTRNENLATPKRPFTRIEVQWKDSKLSHYLWGVRPNARADQGLGDCDFAQNLPVTGFSFETLYKAFRVVMGEVAGVFISSTAVEAKVLPAFMASLSRSMPLSEIEAIYLKLDVHRKRTAQANIRLARQMAANHRNLKLIDYIPEEISAQAAVEMPAVYLKKLREEMKTLSLHSGPISEALRSAYHDENSKSPGHWVPSLHNEYDG